VTDYSLAWRNYLNDFHSERSAITELILRQCTESTGQTPYEWLRSQWIPAAGEVVLDLACGSAPLWTESSNDHVIGVDRSQSELQLAAERLNDVIVGDVGLLPFQDDSIDHIACSMALMVFTPLQQSVDEIARVLRPGGRIHLLLPSRSPVNLIDLVAYSGVKVALSFARFATPPSGEDSKIVETLKSAGLTIERVQRRRFSYQLTDRAAVKSFVRSWYTPNSTPGQLLRAESVLRRFIGREVGIALSRWQVVKASTAGS
jgi:ubiquinone/menaquinone biosynthesis C-methylase UbiE